MRKFVRFLIGFTAALVLLGAGGYLAARHFLPGMLAGWVAGPQFNRLVSQAVGNALKVDGRFGTLSLQPDLSVTAEGFTSTGWPGQAIGGLDTGRATGWFDPWAMFEGKWSVPRIDVERATFRLVPPNNALKKNDPVPPPKPWYAFLMPSEFQCGWIDCPDMTIELPVGNTTVRGANLQIGAMMIDRNFKYFGRGGVLDYPGYARFAIDALEVYVTRQVIDIGYLYLREPESPKSNLSLKVRLGQQQDKSIDAAAKIDSLALGPLLPSDIARVLSGRLSGDLTYKTDTTGGNATGGGTLRVDNALLANWDYLDGLAARANNPALRRLAFRNVSLDYALSGDTFSVSNLSVSGREQIDLRGSGTWNMTTDTATVALSASRIPLRAYLPAKISEGMSGELSGQANWAWRGTDILKGRGGGTLRLSGADLRDFQFQKFLSRFLKDKSYDNLPLQRASLRWQQDNKGLRVDQIDVTSNGLAGLRGAVQISDHGRLSGTVYAGLPAASLRWLPDATKTVFGREENGLYWCTIKIWGTERKPETDITEQILKQLDRHPLAMAGLALRGLSWWLGDALGTATTD